MKEVENQNSSDLDTYVFVDVSNIRMACQMSLGLNLDFLRLYNYLEKKYPRLREVRYYEGIANGDERKKRHFDFLESQGYIIYSLERMAYKSPAKFASFECGVCGGINIVQVASEKVRLKSNVDVYLAANMLECAAKRPVHIVLISCDGDYAEAIQALLRISPNSRITVLATPTTHHNNCLSVRLKSLSKVLPRKNYKLTNINNIRDKVAQLPKN